MKYMFLILNLCLIGCGEIERELAPNVITIENNLRSGLVEILEIAIEEEACHQVEKRGFECNIPEQVDGIYFYWTHDSKNTVQYTLDFCLKADCPAEFQNTD